MIVKFLTVVSMLYCSSLVWGQTNNVSPECMPGTCTLTDQVINGNFDTGVLAPATTDVAVLGGACLMNSYLVTDNSRNACPLLASWLDNFDFNNPGVGNMLVIDSPPPNTVIWEQNVTLFSSETYLFEISVLPCVSNFSVTAAPRLKVQLVDLPGNVFPITTIDNYSEGWTNWNNSCETYSPIVDGNYRLQIIQFDPGSHGDYAIDNIHLSSIDEVTAVQPTITLCSNSDPINIGAEYTPTGNVYWTNGFFTPVDGFSSSIPTPGGSFASLPLGVSTTTFGAFDLYSFDPGSVPPGTYPVVYQYDDSSTTNCAGSAVMEIVVEGPPAISFSQLPINLCGYNGPDTLVPIIPLGVTCTFSGLFINSAGVFDAAMAGIGTHFFDITCVSSNGCSNTITASIDVIEEQSWHQTSSNVIAPSNFGDRGVDIFTDREGYVYETGSFYTETTFNDLLGNSITITSTQGSKESFYTTCYDACGELQWVIYDRYSGPGSNESVGFGLSKTDDELIIGFNYQNQTQLVTAYPNGTVVNSSVNGSQGTSAVIGHAAIIAVDGPSSSTFGEVNAIEDTYNDYFGRALITESAGSLVNVYISGKSDDNADGIESASISKLQYNITSNFLSVSWVNSSLGQSTVDVANDIILEPTTNQLYVTGTFSGGVNFNGTSINTGLISDAFIATFNPFSGIINPGRLRQLRLANGGNAQGTCLATNGTRYVYWGGDFIGVANNPFGGFLPTPAPIFNGTSGTNSYIYVYDIITGATDIHHIFNTSSYTNLTGMDANEDELRFVGHYGDGIPEISGTTSLAANNTITGSGNQIFIGEFSIGTGGWNTPEIVNSTNDILASTLGADHISSRVSVGGDHAFLTGTYTGNMDYFNGTPFSGVLTSTGANTNNYNAFALRQEILTNQFRSPIDTDFQIETEIIEANLESELVINIFPNPTNGLTTVQVQGNSENSSYSVEVYNLQGERLINNIAVNAQVEIDLSQFENGVYLVKITLESNTKLVKVVKS